MKKLIVGCLAALVTYVMPTSAIAGDCVVTITRVACPGREAICYSKCNGVPTCDETKKFDSKEECEKEALRNCTVFRPGDTKEKKVIAKFNESSLNDGKNYCDPVKPEFNYNLCD